MTKYYAGIGSRNTPDHIQNIMTRLATKLEQEGWILRSGGAEGADSAFERGVMRPQANAEIYLPWYKFPAKPKDPRVQPRIAGSQPQFINYQTLPTAQAARQTVPIYNDSYVGRQDWWFDLMARNAMQILGSDLNTPSKMVIAYTPNAAKGWKNDPTDIYKRRREPGSGGTGHALRIAEARPEIEIRNLADPAVEYAAKRYLGLI